MVWTFRGQLDFAARTSNWHFWFSYATYMYTQSLAFFLLVTINNYCWLKGRIMINFAFQNPPLTFTFAK